MAAKVIKEPMNRQEMLDKIKTGESVIYQGRLLLKADDVPTEAELAEGDEAKLAAASDALEQEIAAKQAELAKLNKDIATAKSNPKSEGGSKTGKDNKS